MSITGELRLTPAEVRRIDLELAAANRDHPAGRLKPGVTSPRGVAVAAADGFLFLSDGANHWERQYAGAAPPDPWLEAWLTLLQRRQAAATERGVELWNLVIPEKQVIYPEKRWPEGAPDSSNRPMRRILRHLAPEVRLLYAEEALLRAKAEGAAVYAARDSHWSASGCLAVMGELLARIAPEMDVEQLRLPATRLNQAQDLTQHFFTATPPEPFLLLTNEGERTFDNRQHERTGRHAGSVYLQSNAAAPDPRPVVVFGDSYAYDMGVVAVLTNQFAEVAFVWSKSVDWNVVAQREAKIVVCESAERFLITTPEA